MEFPVNGGNGHQLSLANSSQPGSSDNEGCTCSICVRQPENNGENGVGCSICDRLNVNYEHSHLNCSLCVRSAEDNINANGTANNSTVDSCQNLQYQGEAVPENMYERQVEEFRNTQSHEDNCSINSDAGEMHQNYFDESLINGYEYLENGNGNNEDFRNRENGRNRYANGYVNDQTLLQGNTAYPGNSSENNYDSRNNYANSTTIGTNRGDSLRRHGNNISDNNRVFIYCERCRIFHRYNYVGQTVINNTWQNCFVSQYCCCDGCCQHCRYGLECGYRRHRCCATCCCRRRRHIH